MMSESLKLKGETHSYRNKLVFRTSKKVNGQNGKSEFTDVVILFKPIRV